MSVELFNAAGELGQFASSMGYSELIEAGQSNPVLKQFFNDASTENVTPVIAALESLKGDKELTDTAKQLAALMHNQKLVFISNGTYGDDEDEDTDKADAVEISGTIVKVDKAQHLVFGWFSIVSIGGKAITDTQGDIITAATIEGAAYDFVLNARKGGEMHESDDSGAVRGIGHVVESVVFTPEKQEAMLQSLHAQGITGAVLDLKCVAWWGGFFVESDDTWDKITEGKLRAFSIGGRGKRAAL